MQLGASLPDVVIFAFILEPKVSRGMWTNCWLLIPEGKVCDLTIDVKVAVDVITLLPGPMEVKPYSLKCECFECL